MTRCALLLLAVCLLPGCAAEKVLEHPPMAQQLVDRGRQGQAAYFKGDLRRAAELFEQALRDARRIEDSNGVAIMSLNLARVRRDEGDSALALDTVQSVSAWHRQNIEGRTRRELDLLTAVLLADQGQGESAMQSLKALRLDCQPGCEIALSIDSLEARLLLEEGDADGALRLATAAIARSQGQGTTSELANLQRVVGEAELRRGSHDAARRALEAALATDKALGQPAKIMQDLEALVLTAKAAGDSASQAAYQARLDEVRQAVSNKQVNADRRKK